MATPVTPSSASVTKMEMLILFLLLQLCLPTGPVQAAATSHYHTAANPPTQQLYVEPYRSEVKRHYHHLVVHVAAKSECWPQIASPNEIQICSQHGTRPHIYKE